jgi:ubiquitin-conjugating enzyme E2 N
MQRRTVNRGHRNVSSDETETKKVEEAKLVDPETLEWSDEEPDWIVQTPAQKAAQRYEDYVTDQPQVVSPDVKKADYKRSKKFRGDVIVEHKRVKGLLKREERVPNYASYKYPMPYLADYIHANLGADIIEHLWHEFIEHGADASELVQKHKLKSISQKMETHLNRKLPFDKLHFKGLEKSDFVDFLDVCSQLSLVAERQGILLRAPDVAPAKVPLPPCCALEHCGPYDLANNQQDNHDNGHSHNHMSDKADSKQGSRSNSRRSSKAGSKAGSRRGSKVGSRRNSKVGSRRNSINGGDEDDKGSKMGGLEEGDEGEEEEEEEEDLEMIYYALNVTFMNFCQEHKGNCRLKNIPELMEIAKIPYDKSRLDSKEWDLRGENLIANTTELDIIAGKIRTDWDKDEDDDIATGLYALPDWMKNEFKKSEIMLFKHHFMDVDVDEGGSIDEEELQLLTETLGARVSLEEAKDLIETMDLDGGGTVSFDEFMMLMYKIQNGVIDLEGNLLAKSMVAAKSQLAIFEEIEANMADPIPGVEIKSYGGTPVACDMVLTGPEGSAYEGGNYHVRVVFLDGYPYNCPQITFVTRLYHLNILLQYNGEGYLQHIAQLWDSSWNIAKLCEHIMELLREPTLDLVPAEFKDIVKLFLGEKLRVMRMADKERREQIAYNREQARLAEEARLAAIAEQEEFDRLEEISRKREVRGMAGEDWNEDNMYEISDMEKEDFNTIEEEDVKFYRRKELQLIYQESYLQMTDSEQQKWHEDMEANQEMDFEEQEKLRLEKEAAAQLREEERIRKLEEAEAWAIEQERLRLEAEEEKRRQEEEEDNAGTDPVLNYLATLLGDSTDNSTAQKSQPVTSADLMKQLGRVEQMHLTTIQMYMFERERYQGVVDMYKEKFAKVFNVDKQEIEFVESDEEGEEKGDKGEKGEYEGDSKEGSTFAAKEVADAKNSYSDNHSDAKGHPVDDDDDAFGRDDVINVKRPYDRLRLDDDDDDSSDGDDLSAFD